MRKAASDEIQRAFDALPGGPWHEPAIVPGMIEMLREIEQDRARIVALVREQPPSWDRAETIRDLRRRVGALIAMVRVRARELLEAALDSCHGQDPDVEQETRAYLLWVEVNR